MECVEVVCELGIIIVDFGGLVLMKEVIVVVVKEIRMRLGFGKVVQQRLLVYVCSICFEWL